HNCRVDEHLGSSLFFQHFAHLGITGCDRQDFADLPAHLAGLGDEGDSTGDRRGAYALLEPHQRLREVRSPVHVPLDPPDLVTEQPEVGIHHDGNGLYNCQPDLVDARHPLKKIRDQRLDTEDFSGPELIKDGIRDEHDEERYHEVAVNDPDKYLEVLVVGHPRPDEYHVEDCNGYCDIEREVDIMDKTFQGVTEMVEERPDPVIFFQLLKKRSFIGFFDDGNIGIGMEPFCPDIPFSLFRFYRDQVDQQDEYHRANGHNCINDQ